MNPLHYIRKDVLGLSQAAMAVVVGVSQGTISRWETGELCPDRDEMGKIRREARRRGLDWDDRWFFEHPAEAAR